jgi:hypothetical protein
MVLPLAPVNAIEAAGRLNRSRMSWSFPCGVAIYFSCTLACSSMMRGTPLGTLTAKS